MFLGNVGQGFDGFEGLSGCDTVESLTFSRFILVLGIKNLNAIGCRRGSASGVDVGVFSGLTQTRFAGVDFRQNEHAVLTGSNWMEMDVGVGIDPLEVYHFRRQRSLQVDSDQRIDSVKSVENVFGFAID